MFNQYFLRCLLIVSLLFPVLEYRAQTAGLYINEVSQGPSGSKEYVELIVVGTPTCYSIPTLDLRGWYIDDNNGFHATGAGTGIAAGCVRFSQDPLWAAIPIGTLIVIYNDADLNASVPAIDLSMTDSNCRLVVPVSNCTLLEKHTTLPSTVASPYPTFGLTTCGNWNNVSMANSDDSFHTVDPAGNVFHSVSWGNNTLNTIIYFNGTAAGTVALMTNAVNNNINSQSNWTRVSTAGAESPGVANNASNQQWICGMNNGCSPLVPISTIGTTTNAGCTCNGSASVIPSGGFSGCSIGYSYSWSPSGGTSSTATGLCAGSYTVTVSDVNGCTAIRTYSISAVPTLTLTTSQTNVACFGGNTGTATVNASGGVGPYSYSWLPTGGNAQSATGLTAGTYTVTVTDAASCSSTVQISITQPPVVSLTATQTNVLCNGSATGVASVTASGGSGTFSYAWAPSGGNTSTASGLTSGTYTVTVTTSNGCTATQTYAITQPSALSITDTQTNVSCNGALDGSASILVSGGVATYSYSWAPTGGTGSSAIGLGAGGYTVTVTDANNCTTSSVISITQPPVISTTTSITQSICGNANGSASVSVSGGNSPYTYLWTPSGGTGPVATGLLSGIYSVTITDVNNCSSTATVNVTNAGSPAATITSSTNASCFGSNDGSAVVLATGGSGAYSYSWSPSGGPGTSAIGLVAGNYTVIVSDANGCSATASVTIAEPPVLTATATSSPVLCFGANSGTASISVVGGTPTYTYAWSPSGGGASASGLGAGVYSVTVTDGNGCTTSVSTQITEPTALTATTSFTQSTCGNSNGTMSATPSGGMPGYSYSWSPSGGNTSTETGVAAGSYTVLITDSNGCTTSVTQIVTNINGVNASLLSSNNLTCFNSADGTINIAASGGTGIYTYSWSPAVSSGAGASGLNAGTYSVTVTDSASCTSTVTVALTQPPMLNIQASGLPSVVCQGSAVTLNANAAGGTPAYAFTWMPGSFNGANQTLTPSQTTSFSVIVTDANGCIDSASTIIIVDTVPVVNFMADVTSGCAALCVNFGDMSSGAPASWLWDFGDNTTSAMQNPPVHCYNNPGTYSVNLTVSSSSGCVQTLTLGNYINVYPSPIATFGASPLPATILNPTIIFSDSSQNAASWLWNFGDVNNSSSSLSNPSFTYPSADCYVVTLEVTSLNGCTDTATMPICLDEEITIYVPNAFTPDGDGLNDYFIPFGEGFDWSTLHMIIFDRWGNLIFESNDINTPWDGRVQGCADLVQIDTYVWKIEIIDVKNVKHYFIGHVNVIR